MENFIVEHSVLVVIILSIILITSIILCFYFVSQNIEEIDNKAKLIITFCEKKHCTFANLRDELPTMSSMVYSDLFEINFELEDIEDETEVTITLYFSKKDTEKKLREMLGNSLYICKIGNIHIKKKEKQ